MSMHTDSDFIRSLRLTQEVRDGFGHVGYVQELSLDTSGPGSDEVGYVTVWWPPPSQEEDGYAVVYGTTAYRRLYPDQIDAPLSMLRHMMGRMTTQKT